MNAADMDRLLFDCLDLFPDKDAVLSWNPKDEHLKLIYKKLEEVVSYPDCIDALKEYHTIFEDSKKEFLLYKEENWNRKRRIVETTDDETEKDDISSPECKTNRLKKSNNNKSKKIDTILL